MFGIFFESSYNMVASDLNINLEHATKVRVEKTDAKTTKTAERASLTKDRTGMLQLKSDFCRTSIS